MQELKNQELSTEQMDAVIGGVCCCCKTVNGKRVCSQESSEEECARKGGVCNGTTCGK